MDQIMSQIIGYTFKAENYTPEGVIAALYADERYDGWQTIPGYHMPVEDNLNEIAYHEGIDRNDEHSFDSEDFPKVILSTKDTQDLILVDEDGDAHLYEEEGY